jgi:hypothetical protein
MKNDLVKKILPHLIAIVVFLLVAVFFCRPVLEGNVLNQSDIIGWKGMAQNAFEYKERTGHFPLWNPNAFGGMPNYMIAMEGKNVLPDMNKIFGLGLPQPISFFFIACVCFYILCLSFRLKPVVGVFGALAFAFATYNPIIIAAGHVTKMFAIAYMPLLVAGLINTYERRYWLGLALTTLGTYTLISSNHPQISYYTFIIAAAVTIAYFVSWAQKKEWKHAGIAFGVTAISAIAGLMTTALSLMVTTEYAKSTIRGGKTIEVVGDSVRAVSNTGLDTGYAFAYSLGRGEAITVLMPEAYGGNGRKPLNEKSKVVDKLAGLGIPENQSIQVVSSLPRFWGNDDSTAGGPLYSGAIICILALLGFVLVKHPIRWALLGVSVLAILMAWGEHFKSLNLFLFNNLPLYNKFRAPSITMVIVQFTLPLAAALGLNWLLFREKSQALLKADFKKILYAVGGLTVFLLLMYFMLDYRAGYDQDIQSRQWDESGNDTIGRTIVSGLKADRSSLFGMQILRTLGFAVLVIAALWLYLKNILKPATVVIALAAITTIDLLVVDKEYLGPDSYKSKDEVQFENFTKLPADEQILADKEVGFRVFNAGSDRFMTPDARASYFHRAVGGYHPAKLKNYQSLIERYLMRGANPQVLNMLNTKYVLAPDQQSGKPNVIPNPDAYGPAWFVKYIKYVKDDVEEMQSIGSTNLKDTAIVQQSFTPNAPQPVWDSTATIALSKFDNDELEYTTSSQTPQFAVLSEVYYADGWNAYIDGKKTPYVKTNFVLRGIAVPAGKHTIRFVFEPEVYKKGNTISFVGSILVALLVLGGLYMAVRPGIRAGKS